MNWDVMTSIVNAGAAEPGGKWVQVQRDCRRTNLIVAELVAHNLLADFGNFEYRITAEGKSCLTSCRKCANPVK